MIVGCCCVDCFCWLGDGDLFFSFETHNVAGTVAAGDLIFLK